MTDKPVPVSGWIWQKMCIGWWSLTTPPNLLLGALSVWATANECILGIWNLVGKDGFEHVLLISLQCFLSWSGWFHTALLSRTAYMLFAYLPWNWEGQIGVEPISLHDTKRKSAASTACFSTKRSNHAWATGPLAFDQDFHPDFGDVWVTASKGWAIEQVRLDKG